MEKKRKKKEKGKKTRQNPAGTQPAAVLGESISRGANRLSKDPFNASLKLGKKKHRPHRKTRLIYRRGLRGLFVFKVIPIIPITPII